MPSLGGAIEWLNSAPLTPAALHGKVVLIDFWTYTCVNWTRTLPYVRAWAEKYKDKGLVVVGVHTPEFSFEKNIDNVRAAMKEMRVDYPVAIDSNYDIWNAFKNEYWPAEYLVDAQGHIRYHHFGEGAYERDGKGNSRVCSSRRDTATPAPAWCPSIRAVWKLPPTGRTYNLRKTFSVINVRRALLRRAAQY